MRTASRAMAANLASDVSWRTLLILAPRVSGRKRRVCGYFTWWSGGAGFFGGARIHRSKSVHLPERHGSLPSQIGPKICRKVGTFARMPPEEDSFTRLATAVLESSGGELPRRVGACASWRKCFLFAQSVIKDILIDA